MKKVMSGPPVLALGIPLREGKTKLKHEIGAETLIVQFFFGNLE